MSKILLTYLIRFIFLLCLLVSPSDSLASEGSTFEGYITNKSIAPLKLKIFEIDNDSINLLEKNLENNSFIPSLNLMLTAESSENYNININNENIFIPENTKFIGGITEIIPPKNFNRVGFYKVSFDEVVCPDGSHLYFMSKVVSKSMTNAYNPIKHIGKTTFGLIGGSLAGTLFAYNLGGLGLTIASHGYSLAAGAAAGGFIGAATTLAGKGSPASIQPGNALTIVPVDEASLEELKQINCKQTSNLEDKKSVAKNDVKVEILSIKEKKDILGESALKVMVKIINNSNEHFNLNNFFLRDSQGKEYTTSFIDLKDNMFDEFPPNEMRTTWLEFFVDYPKTSHWLVLKSKDYTKELGSWKIKG